MKRFRFRPPSKGPVRRFILRRLSPAKPAFASLSAFYAALRDIAHELGLGYIARSTLAFAGLSDVVDAGRGGILRVHRSGHAVASREIGCQWRADGDHAAGDRRRRRRYHPRIRPGGSGAPGETASVQTINVSLPALSCVDDLAGETVLAACEKSLFGSAESAAAAVSYAASLITQLTASGDVAAANSSMTPEFQAVRRAVERDRYGLMAQALVARDHCTLSECPAFRAITDTHQIVANMDERTYDGLVSRYAPSWNAPAPRGGGQRSRRLRRRCPPADPPMPSFPPRPRPRRSAS